MRKRHNNGVSASPAFRRVEDGFTFLELTLVLLCIPLWVMLTVQLVSFGEQLDQSTEWKHQEVSQAIVRRIWDSRACHIEQGQFQGTYVREDGTTWAWTLKVIRGNLVMVGKEGGNLLFIRGIDSYGVEQVGDGYRIRWRFDETWREKALLCARTDFT